jgi:hypothetical protein
MGFVYQARGYRQVLIRYSVLVHSIFVALPYRPIIWMCHGQFMANPGTQAPSAAFPPAMVLGLPWQLGLAP